MLVFRAKRPVRVTPAHHGACGAGGGFRALCFCLFQRSSAIEAPYLDRVLEALNPKPLGPGRPLALPNRPPPPPPPPDVRHQLDFLWHEGGEGSRGF